MSDLQRVVVLCVVAAAIAVAAVWYQNTAHAPGPSDIADPAMSLNGKVSEEAVADFTFALEEAVRVNIGQPIEGYEPEMFMQVYPGLEPQDFDGVASQQGHYAYVEGELRHELNETKLVHSAATAISKEGMQTLLENVLERLPEVTTVASVLGELQGNDVSTPSPEPVPLPTPVPEPVACTMDAKQCPDGSYVGRVGPNCEFAACPNTSPQAEVTQCTDEMKQNQVCTREYRPVCGLVEVQCVTTPCDPIPETFSNGCTACAQGNVISYSEGSCEL